MRCAWPICNVPVLMQATPDTPARMTIADRRDSFCGKMSRLQQPEAVRHSLLADHAAHRGARFAGVQRATWTGSPPCAAWSAGCGNLRIGAIGARPAAFNTVRYSEKMLESERHLGRAARSFGNPRPHRAPEATKTPTCRASSQAIQQVRSDRRRPDGRADEDGQAGRGDRRLDARQTDLRHQRRAVLDVAWKSTSAWCPAP